MAFHKVSPQRTCTKSYKNYPSFRPYLKDDFNNRCGYCDTLDTHCGEQRIFHIDHFAPKSIFEHLSSSYGNLVYACPFCNLSKSDDWIGTKEEEPNNGTEGYIDPCKTEYQEQLMRDEKGRIKPITKIGEYMHRELKLGLLRHEINWNIEKIRELSSQINEQIRIAKENGTDRFELLTMYHELGEELSNYFNCLECNDSQTKE